METLTAQVTRAQRRLFWQSLLSKLAWCWFATLLLAAAAIAGGKYLAVEQQPWAIGSLAVALAGGLIAALSWAWLRRPNRLQAALAIDERFGLRQRVSSSLTLSSRELESPAGQALLHDAEQKLRRLSVPEAFGLKVDRRAALPLVPLAISLALALWLPVSPTNPQGQVVAATALAPQQATKALAKKLTEQREQSAKDLRELESVAKLEAGAKKLAESKPVDQKTTLRELNDLVKDAQKRQQELAGAADLKNQLAQLKNMQQGPGDKLNQALKQGKLDLAVKELEKLREQLAGDKLSPEGKEALAKQLDQLQQAMREKAEAHEQAQRELGEQVEKERQAGNTAQADKLQQQLDKLAAAKPQMDQMRQMAEQLQQAAQQMGEGECQKAADALGEMAEQLQGMEGELQEMEALDQALEQVAECKRSMACSQCQGEGCEACQGQGQGRKGGQMVRRNGGKGGLEAGVGNGPGLGKETDPQGKFFDSNVKQQAGKGAAKVVGQADGPNRKGQVQEAIQTEFSAAEQRGADALTDQRLPHDYRDHAQRYFDALREGSK